MVREKEEGGIKIKMCQGDIVKYLREQKRIGNKGSDMQELMVHIPANRAAISRGCRKLRESGDVKFRKKKIKSYEKFIYSL